MPSQQSPPSPPNTSQTYGQGIQTFLKFLPEMLNQEYNYRGQFDPKFIQQQQGLQDEFGPKQYQQQLSALDQLNPMFRQVYGALGKNVMGGLDPNNPYVAQSNQLATQTANEAKLGTQLDPAFANQLQSQIRGAQAARGNVLGNAGISGEALYQGRAGQDLYSQRLQRAGQMGQLAAQQRQLPLSNAGLFLNGTSPVQQVGQIQPVSAPDQFRIVNPNAGYSGQQIGQQNYQNQLAAYSGNQGGSGWGQLAGGIVGGIAGGYFGGPAGAGIGSTAGSTIGGYFSDARIKQDIKEVGKTEHGIPIVEFNFVPWFCSHMGWKDNTRCRGVIAQKVKEVMPEAVVEMPGGLLGVLYHKLGVKFEEV